MSCACVSPFNRPNMQIIVIRSDVGLSNTRVRVKKLPGSESINNPPDGEGKSLLQKRMGPHGHYWFPLDPLLLWNTLSVREYKLTVRIFDQVNSKCDICASSEWMQLRLANFKAQVKPPSSSYTALHAYCLCKTSKWAVFIRHMIGGLPTSRQEDFIPLALFASHWLGSEVPLNLSEALYKYSITITVVITLNITSLPSWRRQAQYLD